MLIPVRSSQLQERRPKSHCPRQLLATTAIILAACLPDADPPPGGTETVVETMGDTTVVRTLSGSVWGAEATLVREITIGRVEGAEEYLFGSIWSIAVDDDWNVYVFDEQAQHVQVYDSAGVYIGTLGGRGEGPGEFSRAEAIALLPDGRLVVRDPGNMRVHVFDPAPGERDEWRYNSGYGYSSGPLYTDGLGRTFLETRDMSRTDFGLHLVVLGSDGTPLDTMPLPSSAYEQATLTAEFSDEGGSGRATSIVPFSPRFVWTVHPNGHFLTGHSSAYRIDVPGDDGVLRIERVHDPVPVSDGERESSVERITRTMRNTQPGWSWNGPPIPDYKPAFLELLVGKGGRVWARLSTEGEPIENENYNPDNPGSVPVRWNEGLRYDVFEPDGTYLGIVLPPEDFNPVTRPVFDGDHVWAVSTDELGVERVVRYRVMVGEG